MSNEEPSKNSHSHDRHLGSVTEMSHNACHMTRLLIFYYSIIILLHNHQLQWPVTYVTWRDEIIIFFSFPCWIHTNNLIAYVGSSILPYVITHIYIYISLSLVCILSYTCVLKTNLNYIHRLTLINIYPRSNIRFHVLTN